MASRRKKPLALDTAELEVWSWPTQDLETGPKVSYFVANKAFLGLFANLKPLAPSSPSCLPFVVKSLHQEVSSELLLTTNEEEVGDA